MHLFEHVANAQNSHSVSTEKAEMLCKQPLEEHCDTSLKFSACFLPTISRVLHIFVGSPRVMIYRHMIGRLVTRTDLLMIPAKFKIPATERFQTSRVRTAPDLRSNKAASFLVFSVTSRHLEVVTVALQPSAVLLLGHTHTLFPLVKQAALFDCIPLVFVCVKSIPTLFCPP